MKKERYSTTILTGRVILLGKDKSILSPVYKGNAFPNGNGNEIVSYLSQVYSEKHFQRYIRSFSKRKYDYDKNEELFIVRSITDFSKDGVVDFPSLEYEKYFLADWLYFKNIGHKPISMVFKDGHRIILEQRDTIATRNGYAIPYPAKSILKTKDTINSIILIEKIN